MIPSLSDPLRFGDPERELKDSFERILPIKLSGDRAWKIGRSVGRQAATTATPASTWLQTTVFVETPKDLSVNVFGLQCVLEVFRTDEITRACSSI